MAVETKIVEAVVTTDTNVHVVMDKAIVTRSEFTAGFAAMLQAAARPIINTSRANPVGMTFGCGFSHNENAMPLMTVNMMPVGTKATNPPTVATDRTASADPTIESITTVNAKSAAHMYRISTLSRCE